MHIATQKIAPFLWFDTEAEEAAKFYVFDREQVRMRHNSVAGVRASI